MPKREVWSPEALTYLERRGLRSSEMVERFRLGFANRTLGYRLPKKNRQTGEAMRGRLESLGILRETGHEHFNGSVVIPIFDERGAVTEIYGRKITPGLRKGTPLHLYLPGPHRGVWNVQALVASKEMILCESLIDALTFWCAGFRHVTASYGVEGFTPDHLDAFRRYGTERVLIAYDRDDAGDRAAEKLADKLGTEGIETYRVVFPRGMDANEYALKVTPAEKSLSLALRQAVWLGKGKAASASTAMEMVAMSPPTAPTPGPASLKREPEAWSWDDWHRRAVDAGVPEELAGRGRAVMREADQHGWDEALRRRCGWDDGGAEMIRQALADADKVAREWQHLLDTDGRPSAWDEDDGTSVQTGEVTEEPEAVLAPTEETTPAVSPPPTSEVPSPPEPAPPELPSLVASPAPPPELASQVKGEEVVFTLGDRRYRVRGLGKNMSLDQLRVNVLCGRGEVFFADTLDLYSARQRGAFVKQAAEELAIVEDVVKKDLGRVLLALESLQEKQIEEAQAPKDKAVMLSEAETTAALELLRDPKLLDRIPTSPAVASSARRKTSSSATSQRCRESSRSPWPSSSRARRRRGSRRSWRPSSPSCRRRSGSSTRR
jgi:hypothetical protein